MNRRSFFTAVLPSAAALAAAPLLSRQPEEPPPALQFGTPQCPACLNVLWINASPRDRVKLLPVPNQHVLIGTCDACKKNFTVKPWQVR